MPTTIRFVTIDNLFRVSFVCVHIFRSCTGQMLHRNQSVFVSNLDIVNHNGCRMNNQKPFGKTLTYARKQFWECTEGRGHNPDKFTPNLRPRKSRRNSERER